MASFTSEEVDLVKSRGNDLCRSTWLALYDQNYSDTSTTSKDEQHIKDFMIDKYERKRYYHDKGLRNGTVVTPPPRPSPTAAKPSLSNGSVNGNATTVGDDFVADFGSADIFSASQFNNNVTGANQTTSQPSFANFDNNVIFNSANVISTSPLNGFSQSGMNGSSTNGFSPAGGKAPPPSEDRYAALKDLDNALKSQQQHEQQQQHQQQQQQHHQQQQQHHQQQQQHQQPHMEWGSNGSGYASPSPLYGSPSTTGSMYGSPSQGNFMSAFHQQDMPNNISNPFSVNGGVANGTRNPWAANGNSNMNNTVVANNCFNNTAAAFSSSPNNSSGGANPFRDSFSNNSTTNGKFNNVQNGFNGFQHQQNLFPVSNHSSHFSKTWANPNPFTFGVSPGAGGTSNNPFL